MNKQLEVLKPETGAVERAQPTSLSILESAISGGITSENVAVVKELMAMRREEIAEQSKAAFSKSFFQLRKELGPIYADKQVKTKSGDVAFEYCSPAEIQDSIDPLLKRHGFCTMTGQTQPGPGMVEVNVTLFHEAGHSETRTFTVRVSPGNSLMTPTQCDAGATTAAERHLFIKMFGLRTRLRPDNDPRNLGEHITEEQAADLERRVMDTASDSRAFLRFAGVKIGPDEEITADHYRSIMSSKLAVLDDNLRRKEGRK